MSFGFGFGFPKNYAAAAFSPASLFSAGEVGAWYDPSDYTTLFEDAAGTIPITSPLEKPVGLMLDKSKGLVLGSELAVNGDFSSAAGWTAATGVSISGGVADFSSVTNSSALYRAASVSIGKFYLVEVVVTARSAGTITPRLFGDSATPVNITAAGTYRFISTPTTSNTNIGFVATNFTGAVDSISVRELPGAHAYQSASSASRPTLSARVNLLTKTEQFDDAAWVKTNLNTTGTPAWVNVETAPDGTLTAEKIIATTANAGHTLHTLASVVNGLDYRFSVYLKKAEYSQCVIGRALATSGIPTSGTGWYVDLDAGTIVGTPAWAMTVSAVGSSGWYHVTGQFTANATVATNGPAISIRNGTTTVFAGDGTSGIYIWGADLRVANDALNQPAYQRVNTSTDYDTTGFLPYLRFDGSDDWLVTNTITPGTDKAQVFAGVRKLSDGQTVINELSANINSNNGSYGLYTGFPSATYTQFASKGTAAAAAEAAYASPITGVITGLANISGDSSILRVNGTQAASSTADQGTGNYLAYPLYIGRRAEASLPFNGRLYSLITRFGATLTDAQITSTENWVNRKTGAY